MDEEPTEQSSAQPVAAERRTSGLAAARAEIAKIFEPRSVALVGASEREGSLGTVVLRNLVDAGFEGPIHAVNPRYRSVQGRRSVARIGDIGEPVDLAVIVAPARVVPDVIDDCGRHGVHAAVILSGGFREAGDAGKALERRVLETAHAYGIRFVGPNCLGVMRPGAKLNATFSQSMAKPGHIALVSQSGALCTAMLDWASPREIGFSNVISVGIGADVDFGEILDYLVLDSATRAIMLYVEGVHDARRFMSALRAASRVKPVVVMKVGRHAQGRRAAISHTGALVGTDDVFAAALSRAGAVRVLEYADFFAVAETLHVGVAPQGPRLAIVTNGGGPAVMAADAAADKHLVLAELGEETQRRLASLLPGASAIGNPVDVLGDADAARYRAALEACLADPGVDAVLAILIPQALTDAAEVAAEVAAIAGGGAAKPILTCWMGDATMRASRELFRRHRVPSFGTPESAVEAFAAAAAHHANQQLLLQVPEPLRQQAPPDTEAARRIIEGALAAGRQLLDPLESQAVLAAFRVQVQGSRAARDEAAVRTVAEETGFPLAMKLLSPDITHKTDVGGVRLGIGDAEAAVAAYGEMLARARAAAPDARIDGVLLEPMVRAAAGRQLMLGIVSDPVFGPVISVGLGGTLVEIVRDRAVALPPLNRYLAERLVERTRAAAYLRPFRGLPAADRDALVDVILRASEMACELPWIAELDINPLVVDVNGALALDARVVVRPVAPDARRYAHMAIHPYPMRLMRRHRLEDGTAVDVRPIRPEDARIEQEFVARLSDRSRYLRFMYSLKELTPQMLSRFTQIDYDREMALVAVVARADDHGKAGAEDGRPSRVDERLVGVARYVTQPDGRGCEFAVAVADEWQGRGIATRLLEDLIALARERGFERMDGVALRENKNMLVLAKEMGFTQRVAEDDPKLMLLRLEL
jgi:acetyltransferase